MTLQSALVVLVLAPVVCVASRHGRRHAGRALRNHRHIYRHRHHSHDHEIHDHRFHESVSQENTALFAKSLAAVEDDWRIQALLARKCDDGQVDARRCEGLSQSFRESCAAVSGKFVQVSGGSTEQIVHFMELVCGDAAMNDPSRRSQCGSMSGGIVDAKRKSDEAHGPLESMLGDMCEGMWARMVQHEEAPSAQEQARAPAQAAAEDRASSQSRAAGQQAASAAAVAPAAAPAASAAAVAPAAAQGRPSGPSRPRLAAVATRTSVGKAVLVVSGVGSTGEGDREGGDSDGAAAGGEAGDSEDEEGGEDDGRSDDSIADDSKQSDTKDSNKDDGKDEDTDGDEDGDEEGDDNEE